VRAPGHRDDGDRCARRSWTSRRTHPGLIVPFFLLGLILEVLGQSPSKPRDYAGYGFRLVVFVVLLKFYAVVFGSVVNFTEGLATRVTPPDVWDTFSSSHAQNFQKSLEQEIRR